MKPHFSMFAAYNRWANDLLYAAAGKLTEADFRADRGAFFGSVHATLNHLLVTDRIWLVRFTGETSPHRTLDEILFEDFFALRMARQDQDEAIIAFVEGLSEARLAGSFSYTPVSRPVEITQPLAPALAHFFNHQTHHRGQVHALLTQIGGRSAAPSLDLIYFQRESGMGMS